jgi:hypothetical protein
MIVSHRHKFIFVKTRKTAGTSLEIGLSKYCGPDDIITPITQEDEQIRSELGFRGPQNYKVPLRNVRNIIDTVRSWRRRNYYNHMPSKEIINHVGHDVWEEYFTFSIEREPYGKAISRYYWSTKEPRPTIEEYLDTAPVHKLSNWEMYTVNDTPTVDFLIRYERLAERLDEIRSRIGLGEITMPRVKDRYRRDRSHYSRVLSSAARERIEIVCAKEIRHFGYEWVDE